MHELSIIKDLIDEVEEQAKSQKAHKVTKIKLKIGKLEELNLESFKLWFESLSKGSISEGVILEVTTCKEPGVYLESLEMEIGE